jgi:hypothetical protein
MAIYCARLRATIGTSVGIHCQDLSRVRLGTEKKGDTAGPGATVESSPMTVSTHETTAVDLSAYVPAIAKVRKAMKASDDHSPEQALKK